MLGQAHASKMKTRVMKLKQGKEEFRSKKSSNKSKKASL